MDVVRSELNSAGVGIGPDFESTVDQLLMSLVTGGVARFRLDPVTAVPAQTPLRLDETIRRAAELARAEGQTHIFNYWHETVWLSPPDLYALPLLDGTRDRDALITDILALTEQDILRVAHDAEAPQEERKRRVAADYVDSLPQRLVDMKLVRVDRDEADSGQ